MPPPTPELERTIAAFIRAGGFVHVAAAAAGVTRHQLRAWLRKGKKADAPAAYRRFRSAVLQAQAQARLAAESRALQEKPMDWLKSGPGRDAEGSPGWTAPARARPRADKGPADLFRHPQLQKLMRALLDVLAPFPEARAAVVQALDAVEPEAGDTRRRRGGALSSATHC